MNKILGPVITILLFFFGAASFANSADETAQAAEASGPSTVQIEITGLEDQTGDLYISVYNSDDTWLGKDTVMRQHVVIDESRDGNLVTTTLELIPGEYAFSIYYDSNDNGELDTNFIGIPKEPVALSNNARPKFGPPKYEDALFLLAEERHVQRISMEEL